MGDSGGLGMCYLKKKWVQEGGVVELLRILRGCVRACVWICDKWDYDERTAWLKMYPSTVYKTVQVK